MRSIKGEIAWVTGAGSGIGEAAALALAAEGAKVVLTGRRAGPLEEVRQRIAAKGGAAEVRAGDLTKAATVDRIAAEIKAAHGRLDILVSNAGINIPDRSWRRLTPEGIDTLVSGNLSSAIYVARSVLPMMREQGGGVMIHTSSWAGRWVGAVAGPIYTAAKHGVVAMSHSINLEECQSNIRSSVVCPGEVATPIMKLRDPPEPAEIMARMVQPEDMGAIIAFIARQPAHVCLNEVVVSPTHNRGYISMMRGRQQQIEAARKA